MSENRIIKIDTPSTSLVFDACGENVALMHYGKKIADADNYDAVSFNPFDCGFERSLLHDEYAVFFGR